MSEETEIEKMKGDHPDAFVGHAPVPRWLTFSYVFWTLFGIVWFILYWNGSWGWLDRGYWAELQKAANTTFPTENVNELKM